MGIIAKYKQYLPVSEKTPIISMEEGNTPLIKVKNHFKQLDIEVYLKYDGLNPTGSFKDRGMTMAVSKAAEEGAKAIICASTGNTSASAAAYAASAGLKCIVLVPDGKIAAGKMAQAIVYGAEVIKIKGNFDTALKVVRKISEELPITLVNSVNPYRLEGQKTGAFEICDTLGDAPDILCIPVGNAGNISAYWKGFKEYYGLNKASKMPKMFGFQAEGASPFVKGAPVENPETIATAIRIGNPASWDLAVNAVKESDGFFDFVTDEEILNAYKKLASKEGIFAEPASAASFAGLFKYLDKSKLPKGTKVVCILTGNGLKDPDTAVSLGGNVNTLSADYIEIKEFIGSLIK